MKLLHTSDWHLGRSLYDKKRYDEYEAFLNWLTGFIADEKIDLLLVSGDIFDSTAPSNRAQEIYYRFLAQIPGTGCRHVVIIGGNHDSPTFLDAPKKILDALNIIVVGSKTENPEDEVFILKNGNRVTETIVCAVPFLRDRDIRLAEAGESPDDKTQNLLQNISKHYKEIAAIAHNLQDKKNKVPVIGLGHLFTSNARTTEGDGVRELYIGTIAHIDGNNISKGYDYMALGHLHMAQKVDKSETVRYSGSPIPMGFAEAEQTKKIVVAEFNGSTPVITEHDVPCFQKLIQLRGDINTVSAIIGDLTNKDIKAWLEIEITSQTSSVNITALLDDLLKGSHLEILRIKNKSIADRALIPVNDTETLETMSNSEVFIRCLEANEIPEAERASLISTYNEAVETMLTADQNAN